MPPASLTLAAPQWLWPAAGALALTVLLLAWSYRQAPSGRLRWVCLGLKALGVAALAFCLLDPLWSGQRARPGANLLAVITDNSQGLQVKDRDAGESRGESLRRLLDPVSSGWWAGVEDTFELRRFTFDLRLDAVRDFGGLNFEGRASAIGAALKGVRERFAGRPLAGVLLFTDGNATDLRDPLPAFEGLPPIYPVVIGRPGAVRDVSVAQIHVSQTAFEDAPVSLQADVRAVGAAGETVVAQLFDAAGKQVEERTLRARRDDETLGFRFQWRPPAAGVSFYELRVALKTDGPSPDPQASPEATWLNNTRTVAVDRGHGPYRILYVSGRPNWEYKFLNRALAEDDQVHLTGLIRVALREPKFDFRGRAGETGNPLFRGFGDQDREQVERYDQPVLVRLYPNDEARQRHETALRGGFPGVAEALYDFHAVIIDDLEAAFFKPDQAALLAKFVSERGGGLLMLGGAESFRQGQYQRTPVGDALPVYLDTGPEPAATAGWRLNLAREGWLEAWARLRENESDEKARLQAMPAFEVLNPVRGVKPGASVVATVTDERGQEHPALVTQRFGRGRTAAMTVGDLWRWGMRDPDARHDLEKAWRQLARWLVADVPQRVELAVEPAPDQAAGAVRLQVQVRDPEYRPLDEASVMVEVTPAASETNTPAGAVRLRAEPVASEAGLYETLYVARGTGGYRAVVTVTNTVGAEVGRAEAGWAADLAAEEFRSLEPNIALLEQIARRTGGEVVPAAKLAEFVRSLPERRAPVMEAWTVPAWHTPWLFALALACFVAEWGLRRRGGLP